MKVYVAGAAAEVARVTHVIEAARQAGVDVICTWPEVVSATPGGSNPRDATAEQRAGWAAQDLREVAAADCLWFLVPQATTRGAWWEAGAAHALGKLVVCSGDTLQSVFCALGVEFSDDMNALRYIAREAELVAAIREAERSGVA